jgi:peptidyl-tRNA hydrolase, PTH2 family
MEHKQVIVIRKDLKMRRGKEIAQGAHASMGAILQQMRRDGDNMILDLSDKRLEPWITGRFKKICVWVNSETELLDLYQQASDSGLICSLIRDSGLTEFGGVQTITAVAVGPDTSEQVDAITGHLPLY